MSELKEEEERTKEYRKERKKVKGGGGDDKGVQEGEEKFKRESRRFRSTGRRRKS